MKPVHTDGAPKAIGPYSQAIVANGLVYCSGQVALDPATGVLVAGDVKAQTRQVFANLAGVLEAAGSSLSKVVKTTVYLKDMGHFADMNAVYAEAFAGHAPARATIEVARLPKDALVEIDAIGLV